MLKRSQINRALDRAVQFFQNVDFALPAFAHWTPEEWAHKGPECDEIRQTRIGWDVTDFGSGDFDNVGRTIFTLRNGAARNPRYPKSYAQKAMCLVEGQRSPIHFHRSKMEDIISVRGGNVLIRLWQATPDNRLSEEPFDVSIDGIRRRIDPGETVRLQPGMSICVTPRTYHQFWGEEGRGTTLSMEVSTVCDDETDNYGLEALERFPGIDEDETPRYVLCSEYPPAKQD